MVIFLLAFFLFIGYVLSKKAIYENAALNDKSTIAAKQLFEMRCNICHGIKDNTQSMLAPPFYNIKSKYSKVFRTKDIDARPDMRVKIIADDIGMTPTELFELINL